MTVVALSPAEVLAAPPAGPPAPLATGGSGGPAGASGSTLAAGFSCVIDGTVTTIRTAPNLVPDPLLGAAATPLLDRPALSTTPPNLPSGTVGITGDAAITGTASTPALAFAAGFAGATELYEVPNTATDGPAPAGSPGAFDNSQGAPLSALPVGTVTAAGATHTGAGLPYAQVFPILNGTPDFSSPVIPGGIPTTVSYQSYQTNPSAWLPGESQPRSRCGGGREYAVVTFRTAPYVGRELTAGQPYAAYLLVRNTDSIGPLANHLWYFQAAGAPSPRVALAVEVTNDAAGGGGYQQVETAPVAGEGVPFSVAIRDTGTVGETISAVVAGQAGTSAQLCPGLVGQTLSPGGSIHCSFTLRRYSPPAGDSRTETVAVGADQTGLPTSRVTVQGSSSVTTAGVAAPASLAVLVEATNDAAGTGFAKAEEARAALAAVPFQVMIRNSSLVTERISAVAMSYGTVSQPVCAAYEGQDLTAGESITCRFVLAAYAPPAGQSRVATATAAVVAPGDPADSATGSSSSTVTTGPALVAPAVSVVVTNDAAGDGTFLQEEVAPKAGAAVPFRVAIRNSGPAEEEILTVSNHLGATASPECPGLVGQSLSAGQTVYCTFTVTAFAPATGDSRSDVAKVEVAQMGDAANTRLVGATSTVTTAAPQLSVTTTVSSTSAVSGQTLTYTIRVTNRGSAPAQDVHLKDVLSGTAGFTVDDGTGGTPDSFAGRPVEPVTKTAIGEYQWGYPTLGPDGGTAVVVYRAVIRGPSNASAGSNGKVDLRDTVTVVAASGCTPVSCTATVTTSMPVAGSVRAASTVPSGTPMTGAELPLLPAGLLVLAGLSLIAAAEATRPKVSLGKRSPHGGRHRSARASDGRARMGWAALRSSHPDWRWPGASATLQEGDQKVAVDDQPSAAPASGAWLPTGAGHRLYRYADWPTIRSGGRSKSSPVNSLPRLVEAAGLGPRDLMPARSPEKPFESAWSPGKSTGCIRPGTRSPGWQLAWLRPGRGWLPALSTQAALAAQADRAPGSAASARAGPLGLPGFRMHVPLGA